MKSINPYNLELIKEYQEDTEETLNDKLKTAQKAFEQFRKKSIGERSSLFNKLAEDLTENSGEYAKTLTLEMGKPIKEARAEIEKCAWVCQYYAENAAEFLRNRAVETDARESFVCYQPLGVILAVMPWNFPFWQVFRFAAPTLMAGNTAVLKHASNVQGCAFLIEEIFEKAGFPKGVFTNLCISSKRVEGVLRNPLIKGASVTGSEKAGASVAAICGEEIKPTVLELGGSNAFIVLEDADIEKAAALALKARMINNAQSCIAAKRFIVVNSIADEFTEAFKRKLAALKEGDPMNEDVEVGPLARVDLAEDLEDQLNRSLEMGAKLIFGGKRENAHFQPTIISGVKKNMPAYKDELFGPVAPIIIADNADEAIAIANDSRYGLGATIVTEDLDRARELSSRIEDGAVFINELVKSDPRLPFGGTKKSGYGRELSREGIMAFVNVKTVYIAGKIEV